MDDRDHPDTNVFQLRRKDDPGEEERRRIASTIFAEGDEVGPFSRRNLVLPKPAADDKDESEPGNVDESEPRADAYFEQLQEARAAERAALATPERDEETTAYFERLGRQSPAEMAQAGDAPSAEGTLPGSARLPAEAASTGRRTLSIRSRVHGLAAPARWSTHRVRLLFGPGTLRLARPAVLAVLAVPVVAGVAVATMLATTSDHGSSASRQALRGRARTSGQRVSLAGPVKLARIGHSKVRRDRAARHRTRTRPARHAARSKAHIVLASDRTTAPVTSTSNAAPTTSNEGGSSVAAPQYSSPPPSSSSSSTASTSSGSSKRPAFGSNGVLGPGTSPNS
jgi:hypothetical protein